MYETVFLNGEEILMKLDLDNKETGITNASDLMNTLDLSDIVECVSSNEENTNEE